MKSKKGLSKIAPCFMTDIKYTVIQMPIQGMALMLLKSL